MMFPFRRKSKEQVKRQIAKRKWQNHGKDRNDPRSAQHDSVSVRSEINSSVLIWAII